jgi:fluoroquinolone resistance protein
VSPGRPRGKLAAAMDVLTRLQAENDFVDQVFELDDPASELAGFDFAGKDFYRCSFRRLNLGESRWAGARLEDCHFEACDLTRMVTGDVRAHGVHFVGCKLMGVEWTKASLNPQLHFQDCNLRYASFVELKLRTTTFHACQALEANFIDVDLGEADFAGSDLTGSVFRGTVLARADFSSAQGFFVDPAKNKVKDVRIGVETAVLLASFAGMKVSGWSGEEPAPTKRRKR